ncbi:unnamed protein product [Euphydryas editha]|uniref:NADH dehydrogenase [ubiquinone] 1 alpha subcomplex subunit 6 n=1 Tax=Euphydryas editha TaxID=104508 RepID=A0AAU9UEL6_EUPED|nr:unnamed protein product [Euphydryas editha]
MAGKETLRAGCKIARPVLSTNYCEAHRLKHFDIPKSEENCREKLREYFYRNACVTDLRVIDILVIKGFMNLKEMTHMWQQKGHVMAHWHPTYEPKPCDFVGKFLANLD